MERVAVIGDALTLGTRSALTLALATISIDGEAVDVNAHTTIDGADVDYFSILYDFYLSLEPEYLLALYYQYQKFIIPGGDDGFLKLVESNGTEAAVHVDSFLEPDITLVQQPS
jgi:hypothetical protein